MGRASTKSDPPAYRICTRTVMDTTDPDIHFDAAGVSNHWYEYLEQESRYVLKGESGRVKLTETGAAIRDKGTNRRFDCIVGLSGGVDSTYLCLLAKELGLRPLVVHFDNGWNSELAVHNIESTVRGLGFDLYTYVVDWEEFRELQRSYFAAHVVDIEVLTDHAFMAVLYRQAMKHRISYILAGMNIATEAILPSAWVWDKCDLGNIQGIQQKHGRRPISAFRSYPFLSPIRRAFLNRLLKMKVVCPLNWIDYRYDEVKERIKRELGWRDYAGKHFESVFTRFYQGSILPRKFHFDKRRAHLSTLICSGQATRAACTAELQRPVLDPEREKLDRSYVEKKLGFSPKEFEAYLDAPPRSHREYGSSKTFFQTIPWAARARPILRKLFP